MALNSVKSVDIIVILRMIVIQNIRTEITNGYLVKLSGMIQPLVNNGRIILTLSLLHLISVWTVLTGKYRTEKSIINVYAINPNKEENIQYVSQRSNERKTKSLLYKC